MIPDPIDEERVQPDDVGLYADGLSEGELLEYERPAFWAPVLLPLAAVVGGTATDAYVRVMVLRKMCARPDKPYWTREEILQELSFILHPRIFSALARLRRAEIIRGVQTFEQMRLIEITPAGKAVLAALQVLQQFGNDEDLRFGYVVHQLAGAATTGHVQPEVIDVCLSTIHLLITRAEEALELHSERLIEKVHNQIQAQWHWLVKAGEILDRLVAKSDMRDDVHRKAQQTGKVLAQVQAYDSVLKRHGAEIAQQRERMTKSGLSARMVMDWLKALDVEAMCEVASDAWVVIPEPLVLNAADAFEIGEAALTRDRSELPSVPMPPKPTDDPSVGLGELPVDNTDFLSFVETLRRLRAPMALEALALVPDSFERTALRMATLVRAEASCLAVKKGAREAAFDGVNIELEWSQDPLHLDTPAVSKMTGGMVRPKKGEPLK